MGAVLPTTRRSKITHHVPVPVPNPASTIKLKVKHDQKLPRHLAQHQLSLLRPHLSLFFISSLMRLALATTNMNASHG
jgi:hypothetical protein